MNNEKIIKLPKQVEELSVQLDSKAKQIDLEVERARIDNFTSLAQGSTTGDAELIDGRIGADGKTYTNIGGAIREQVSVLDTKIYNINNLENQLLSDVVLTDGKAIHSSGTTYSSATSTCSESYTNVGYCKEIKIKTGTNTGSSFIAFYDINKVFISRIALTSNRDIVLDVPIGAVFIRFSFPILDKSVFTIYGVTKLNAKISVLDIVENSQVKNVSTFDELKIAVEDINTKDIVLVNDIVATEQLTINSDKKINGNLHKVTGNGTLTNLLYVTNCNCVLENLILSKATFNVVNASIGCNLVIRNCDISESTGNDGIGLRGDANVYVYDSKIHDNYDEGISTHETSYIEVYNSHAYNNGFEIGTTNQSGISFGGIHLGGSRMGVVANCYTYNNSSHGISFITIDGNYISTAKCICYNNVSRDNIEAGICFGGASNIVCTNNTTFNNKSGLRFTNKDSKGCNGVICGNNGFKNVTNYSIWSGANEGLEFDTTT